VERLARAETPKRMRWVVQFGLPKKISLCKTAPQLSQGQVAISIWVLQHCLAPVEDIERIHRSLAPQGEVFILNMPKRAVPAVVPATGAFTWAHDGIDVAELLRGRFTLRAEGEPDKTRTPNMADAGAFWMSLVR
jgi:hypothetical protein